ncbi:MAG: hypothetical protein NZM38_03695 [Cytophagales bacterium]|nr:hypothetical protein [Cytophagales bacterium]MDW8383856.1 hypothetical protein [Flammeovirgaceae bacterium]
MKSCLLFCFLCNVVFAQQNFSVLTKYKTEYVELEHVSPTELVYFTKCGEAKGALKLAVTPSSCQFTIDKETYNVSIISGGGDTYKFKYPDALGRIRVAEFYYDKSENLVYFTFNNNERIFVSLEDARKYKNVDECGKK